MLERMKRRAYAPIDANACFWRTYDGQEVDLVEEREGRLFGYECKLQVASGKFSATCNLPPATCHLQATSWQCGQTYVFFEQKCGKILRWFA